jgi:exodeoxyribonuclease V alpha subunit
MRVQKDYKGRMPGLRCSRKVNGAEKTPNGGIDRACITGKPPKGTGEQWCYPNRTRNGEGAVERFGWRFQKGDKVIQTENNYDKDVFNGDIGIVERVDPVEQEVSIRFDDRLVKYDYGELDEVSLAYAVSIHKSQGSEFPAVVIPLAMQHYMLLQRNLIYTGITRGKRLLVLVGQRKPLGIAVRNDRPQRRYSGLLASLRGDG